ncbi:MAG: VacJ family lipoprotein [Nitrospiraceae bacterium]
MGIRFGRAMALCGFALLLLSGCAGHAPSQSDPLVTPAASSTKAVASSAPVKSPSTSATTAVTETDAADEPFDPFATEQESVEEYDPWEPMNVALFEVNRSIDRYALKPIAKAYNFVMPDAAQRGVENFFHNLRTGPRLLNNVLQGKVGGAGRELGRFLLNTTFGLGGFFDVAKHMHIETPDEDFGQTLGYYGVPPGPYMIIPLFPPFTLRDATGYVVDLALDPINWLVFPLVEMRNVPSLVSHPNRTTSSIAQVGGRSAFIVNERSRNLEAFQGVEEATVDLYSAVRNAYLQKRAKQIRE